MLATGLHASLHGREHVVDLDLRLRHSDDVCEVDFASFLGEELPGRLAGRNGELAARGIGYLELSPLALEVEGRAFTFVPTRGGVELRAGDRDAHAVAVLDTGAFSDLVQDLRSTMGLTLGNDVEMRRGATDDFVEWEPVLRAMIDGRPVYEPGSVEFRAADGAPLELDRRFTPEDDDAEIAQFLGEAGFLRLGNWFTREEMAEVSADIDRALPSYAPDDGRSWWARTGAGVNRAVRLQFFHEHSERARALLGDARMTRIAALSSNGHVAGSLEGTNAVEALVKPLDVVEGISDLPWHKDCSLGRHSYRCSGITVGICVTDADRETGELGVVAGSHRASVPPVGVHPKVDLPRVPLPSRVGDATVHLSCTLHMSRPPVRSERRVLYTGFGLPLRPGEVDVGAEKISEIRESAPKRMGAESRDELGRVGSFEL
ncbi:MAG: phytanoyl-CoA dioxygenase family protein [Myxococcales bacterium]|nr:phytanoyl-CoA dioxygenase family protein [Myxococcales bacterium]